MVEIVCFQILIGNMNVLFTSPCITVNLTVVTMLAGYTVVIRGLL